MAQLINADALIEQAHKETGIDAFDAETYREGIDVFVEDFNDGIAIGRYTEAGIERAKADSLHYLRTRLKIAEHLRQNPELLERKIERPVFVMGMARTGTTLMSNLLAADPGRRSPLIFGEPEAWIALMLESLKCAAEGRQPQGNELREQALDDAPAVAGTLTIATEEQIAFAWLADADARFGPLLEAIVQGKYFWIPLHRVAQIHLEAPSDLRDLVWMPAHFRWTNGGEEVQVDWRVRNKGGSYKIVDVLVAGVSMSVTQRSDFASVIQRGGGNVDALIAELKNGRGAKAQ